MKTCFLREGNFPFPPRGSAASQTECNKLNLVKEEKDQMEDILYLNLNKIDKY